jgi:O-antigen biosynthesis protein
LYFQPKKILRNNIEKCHGFFLLGCHSPNTHSIKFFLENYYEHILKIQNIKFYLIGKHLLKFVEYTKRFNNNFVIKGIISQQDFEKFCEQVKINFIPLTYGAGLKGKLVDGLNYETPVITTSVGTEGTDIVDREQVILLNFMENKKIYAKKFVDYYNNNELLNKISVKGKQFFENNYSLNICEKKN